MAPLAPAGGDTGPGRRAAAPRGAGGAGGDVSQPRGLASQGRCRAGLGAEQLRRAGRRCGAGEMQAAPSGTLTLRSPLLLALLLAAGPSWAAPKDGISRPEGPALGQVEPVPNLLHPKPEQLRLLQSYLRRVGHVAQDPARMTWEQVLLYLCALHDHDRSGQLDGLEFMQLLMELGSQQAQGRPSPEAVIVAVDGILEAQDLDKDGLLKPAELLLLLAQVPSAGGEKTAQGAPLELQQPAAAEPGTQAPEAAGPFSEQGEATGPSPRSPGPHDAAGEAPGTQAGG
ncbi:cell growth regulator with EF hand domain protein 1 [Carettochelys insculpta]|uniref:cell growth regulator with EF hand domain protein 1 n=1 Tax=Carettochelys insculpta TaxID=44489 RepID=UPI003EB6DCB3